MEFSIEAASRNLNLLHIRVNERLTNGGMIVILRSDLPHDIQQKFRMCSPDPELLFVLYHRLVYLEGVTGHIIFWPYRIDVQVEEGYLCEDFAEDLRYFLHLLDRNNAPGYEEEVLRVEPRSQPA